MSKLLKVDYYRDNKTGQCYRLKIYNDHNTKIEVSEQEYRNNVRTARGTLWYGEE